MDITGIRLANIEQLVTKFRYGKDFCQAAGIDPTYLSQLRSGAKVLGTELARRIEERMGLAFGHLDALHEADPPAQQGNTSLILAALDSLSPAVRKSMIDLIMELAKAQLSVAPTDSETESTRPARTFDVVVPNDHAEENRTTHKTRR